MAEVEFKLISPLSDRPLRTDLQSLFNLTSPQQT